MDLDSYARTPKQTRGKDQPLQGFKKKKMLQEEMELAHLPAEFGVFCQTPVTLHIYTSSPPSPLSTARLLTIGSLDQLIPSRNHRIAHHHKQCCLFCLVAAAHGMTRNLMTTCLFFQVLFFFQIRWPSFSQYSVNSFYRRSRSDIKPDLLCTALVWQLCIDRDILGMVESGH